MLLQLMPSRGGLDESLERCGLSQWTGTCEERWTVFEVGAEGWKGVEAIMMQGIRNWNRSRAIMDTCYEQGPLLDAWMAKLHNGSEDKIQYLATLKPMIQ